MDAAPLVQNQMHAKTAAIAMIRIATLHMTLPSSACFDNGMCARASAPTTHPNALQQSRGCAPGLNAAHAPFLQNFLHGPQSSLGWLMHPLPAFKLSLTLAADPARHALTAYAGIDGLQSRPPRFLQSKHHHATCELCQPHELLTQRVYSTYSALFEAIYSCDV